jgi:hypothetical protein
MTYYTRKDTKVMLKMLKVILFAKYKRQLTRSKLLERNLAPAGFWSRYFNLSVYFKVTICPGFIGIQIAFTKIHNGKYHTHISPNNAWNTEAGIPTRVSFQTIKYYLPSTIAVVTTNKLVVWELASISRGRQKFRWFRRCKCSI